ncbi:MAG: hypothetical protein ABIG44_00940 [Planctomycetota bacterium]
MLAKQTRSKLAAMITVLTAVVACQSQIPTSAPAALDPTIDKILTRLENRTVSDLQAELTWKLRYVIDLEEDAQLKKGRIWYQQQDPSARFLIHFSKKIVSNRAHQLDERHMFDGRWYTELKSETKTITRREIRRPGDEADPYKLGEGPFPVPFGQKKADILKEFEVTRIPPADDDPENTDHLRLTPREGTQTGQNYKQVEVWIAREGPQNGLPVTVRASKKSGTGQVNSFLTITFKNVKLNQGFSGSVFKIDKPAGYDEHVENLEPITPPSTP